MVFSVSGWVVCVMLGRIESDRSESMSVRRGGAVASELLGGAQRTPYLLHPIFTLDPRGDVGPPRKGTPETA